MKKIYIDEYIDKRLEDWARWIHNIQSGKLGWNPESILCKFQDPSYLAKDRAKPHNPYIANSHAEEIDYAIKILNETHQKNAEAIILYYLCKTEELNRCVRTTYPIGE